jgi:predicted RNA-binding Zn-ribbon protein involved in translation (DUF1610 family)
MNCPKCGVSWLGDPIPKEHEHSYSGTHYLRYIGIDGGYMGIYDGIVAIRCPDCGEDFPRANTGWALEMFSKYKDEVAKHEKK